MNDNFLLREMRWREKFVKNSRGPTLSQALLNQYAREANIIRQELVRRRRNRALARKQAERDVRFAQMVHRYVSNFKKRAYKPQTSTSPAGTLAARAISRHVPPMSYENVQRMMRDMLAARKNLNK